MKVKRFITWIVLFILVLCVFFGVQSKRKVDNSNSIASICDMTGTVAEYGKWVRNGIMLACDSIRNFDPSFRIPIEDGMSNVQDALNAYEKLITVNKARYIICGCNSSSVMTLASRTLKTGTVILSTVASTPNMRDTGPYVFSNRVLGIDEVKSVAEYMSHIGIGSVTIVAHNNEAGQPYIDAFSEALRGTNVILGSKILVEPGCNDFRTDLIKLKEINPEAVLLVTTMQQSINFMKQSLSIGFSPRWFGISSLKTEDFLKNGGEMINNMIIASENTQEESALYYDFVRKYQDEFHEQPNIYAINGYEATFILYDYLNHSKGDNSRSIDELLCGKAFNTISGSICFDDEGMIKNKKVDLFIIQNSNFLRLDAFEQNRQ